MQALEDRVSEIIAKLEEIVVTIGVDKGVILLDHEGRTHPETINGRTVQVYNNEHFSPLGDALIELYELASGAALRWYTWDQVSREIWNGDLWWYDDGEAIYPVNIAWDPTNERFFATLGQWGWTRARELEEMRGRWRPCVEPVPDASYRSNGN